MHWVVTTPPEGLPIDWPALKAHLRIDTDDERTYVLSLAAQAVAHAEERLSTSLMPRTLTAYYEQGDELALPRGPILDGTVRAYVPTEGSSELFGRLRGVGNRTVLILDEPPPAWPIAVEYDAGYQTVEAIPADIIGAIRVHVATLYAWREDISPVSTSTVWKLDQFYAHRSRSSPVA